MPRKKNISLGHPGTEDDPPRRAMDRIKIQVTQAERTELDARAKAAGMTRSRFIVEASLNHPIRSAFDREIAADLMKLSGDQGRYGGLMKKWLSEKRGDGATVADVNASLKAAREIQREVLRLVCSVLGFK